jgi:hypothetical protein
MPSVIETPVQGTNAQATGSQQATTPPVTTTQAPPAWYDNAPEEYLPYVTDKAKEYKNQFEPLKALHHANALLRQRGMLQPGEGSTTEEITAWRRNVGVPENVEGYKLPEIPLELQDSVAIQDLEAVRAIAHKTGIPANGFEPFVREYLELNKAAVNAHNEHKEQQRVAVEQQLQREWGDEYPSKFANIDSFLNTADEQFPGVSETIMNSGVLYNANFVKWLEKTAKAFRPDTILNKGQTTHSDPFERITFLEKQTAALDVGPERTALRKELLDLYGKYGGSKK